MQMDALRDLCERLGAIVPLNELVRACGENITNQLLTSRQVVRVGRSFVTAAPWVEDPRHRTS